MLETAITRFKLAVTATLNAVVRSRTWVNSLVRISLPERGQILVRTRTVITRG